MLCVWFAAADDADNLIAVREFVGLRAWTLLAFLICNDGVGAATSPAAAVCRVTFIFVLDIMVDLAAFIANVPCMRRGAMGTTVG